MPAPKYTGNPTGSGNPPGEHSPKYLDNVETPANFNEKASFRSPMHVGIADKEKVVGNQPKTSSTRTVDSLSNREESI